MVGFIPTVFRGRLAFGLALLLAAAGCKHNDYAAKTLAAPATTVDRPISAYALEDVRVSMAPGAKLEWFEEDLWTGDRVAERVAATFEDWAARGAGRVLRGAAPARLEVEVTKFDSITALTRLTMGGHHDIAANFRLVDVATGEVIAAGTDLEFDQIALGRLGFVVARMAGRTQRVRIGERIEQVTGWWLSYAESLRDGVDEREALRRNGLLASNPSSGAPVL